MSKNLADIIESFILRQLLEAQVVMLSRNQLAQQLNCAPSQISYVLQSRFTRDRGFELQSRRGSGGFVRICRYTEPYSEHGEQQGRLKDVLESILQNYELEDCQLHVLTALQMLLERHQCSLEQLEWVAGALIHVVGIPEHELLEKGSDSL